MRRTPSSMVSRRNLRRRSATTTVTRDLWHRFYEHQMQIDGGKNDGYAAWSDAGGLALGYYDYSRSSLYALAREFVLADNFFQGAFGGSFLNHQYLICACAPEYPNADTAGAKPSIAILEKEAAGGYLPRLKTATKPPASALDEPPTFAKSGDIAPLNYFGDGKFHAVNTMQPPYQPSRNKPAAGDAGFAYADPNNATTLPPQTARTIGDALDAKGVAWAWYAGAWNAAVKRRHPPAVEKARSHLRAGNRGRQPRFSGPSSAFQLLRAFRSADARGATRGAFEGLRRFAGGPRGRPIAAGGVLQTARQFESARRLRFGGGRRCTHRGSGRQTARRPAVESHDDRNHVR